MTQPGPRPGDAETPHDDFDISRFRPPTPREQPVEPPDAAPSFTSTWTMPTPTSGFDPDEQLDAAGRLPAPEPEDPFESDDEEEAFVEYDDDDGSGRRTVTMARGAFLTMVTLGAVAILALGAATAWLALDRGGGDDPVVATVNGESIRRSEYDKAVAQGNGSEVLDNLVLERLISSEAKKRNVSVDPTETAKLLDEQKQQFGSDGAFQAALEQAGLTEEDLTRQLRLSAMLRRMVSDKIQVTDDEVNQTFTANAAQFAGQPEGQAKEQIRSNLLRQKEGAAARDFIDQLRADAKIETKLPGKQS